MRVLVTGANGFVGRAVCRALCRAGHEVTAAVRSPDRAMAGIAAARFVAVGNIDGGTDWTAAIDGAEAVVHLVSPSATVLAAGDEAALCREIIEGGTRALAAASARAGVSRFIFMSSIKANGEGTDGRPLTAADTPRPEGPYGRAKLAAEAAIEQISRDAGMRVTVIRPPAVYGPGSRGNVYALARVVRTMPTIALPVGWLSNRRSFIFVENLASATVAAVEDKAPVNRIFLVRDPKVISTTRLVELILAGFDRSPRFLPPVPGPLAPALLAVAGRVGLVRRLYGDLDIDDEATRAALSWTPPVPTEEAIARTMAWIRDGEDRPNLTADPAGLGPEPSR